MLLESFSRSVVRLEPGLPFALRENCPSVVLIFEVVSPSSAVVLVSKGREWNSSYLKLKMKNNNLEECIFCSEITGLLLSIPLHLCADGSNPWRNWCLFWQKISSGLNCDVGYKDRRDRQERLVMARLRRKVERKSVRVHFYELAGKREL